MSRVQLIVASYNSLEAGRMVSTDVKIENHEYVRGVDIYDFEPEGDTKRVSSQLDPVLRIEDINRLVGQLLTFIDASISEPIQRQAMKDEIKQKVWNWDEALQSPITRAWRKNKGLED